MMALTGVWDALQPPVFARRWLPASPALPSTPSSLYRRLRTARYKPSFETPNNLGWRSASVRP